MSESPPVWERWSLKRNVKEMENSSIFRLSILTHISGICLSSSLSTPDLKCFLAFTLLSCCHLSYPKWSIKSARGMINRGLFVPSKG